MSGVTKDIGRVLNDTELTLRQKRVLAGVLLILPTLVVVGVLIGYPLLYNVWLSFTNKGLLAPSYEIVGIANYSEIISDGRYWNALINDFIYASATTLVAVVIGVAVSLLLNYGDWRGKGLAITLVIYPYLVPTIVTTTAFQWLFNPSFGPWNYFLIELGLIESPLGWFSAFPMLSVTLVSIWRFMPFVVIICLARLQSIPDVLYEAAKVERANPWQRFMHVTFPQLKLVLFVAVIMRFIWVFNMFDIIWLLTGGGPARATEHLPVLVYHVMFSSYEVGYAAAIATSILVILGALLAIYFWTTDSWEG